MAKAHQLPYPCKAAYHFETEARAELKGADVGICHDTQDQNQGGMRCLSRKGERQVIDCQLFDAPKR